MVHRLSSVILFKAEPNALYNESSNHVLGSEAAHYKLRFISFQAIVSLLNYVFYLLVHLVQSKTSADKKIVQIRPFKKVE